MSRGPRRHALRVIHRLYPIKERRTGAADPWGEITVSPRAVAGIHVCAAALSATFLCGTAVLVHRYYETGGNLQLNPVLLNILAQCNLAVENVLAVWYSSMLLLATAIVSVVCFLVERTLHQASALRFGWIGLAAILGALSLDELGSLHERMSLPPGVLGWIGWLGPFVITVPGYMLLFAWFRLRRSKLAFAYACIGVLLFVTIPLQEFFEVNVMFAHAGPGWHRPVALVLLEEGTELAAIQFLLAAVCRYALDILGEKRSGRVVLALRMPPSWVMLTLYSAVVGGSLLAAYGIGMIVRPDPASGTPENWLPSALAFVAGVMALPLGQHARRCGERSSYLVLAATSVIISTYVGGNVVYDAVRVVLVAGVVLAAAAAAGLTASPAVRLGSVTWGGLAVGALVTSDVLITRLLVTAAAAALILGVYLGMGQLATQPVRMTAHQARHRTRRAVPTSVYDSFKSRFTTGFR